MKLKISLFLIIPTLVSAGKPVGAGVAEEAGKQTKESLNVAKDAFLEIMREVPKATFGIGYNMVAGPATAAKDGVVYTADKVTSGAKSTAQTVCEHPYATGGALAGLGILAATIHYVGEYFPSREETHRRAKLEHEAAEHKQAADSIATETEFRTCLNAHFRCMEPGQRMPRTCHSPARRLSLLNPTKLDEMLNALNKFKE